jgi:hypothetical protein
MNRAIMTVATLAAFAAASIPAIADDTGAATMHDLRKEGGRSCMVDHIHAGTGEGKTKATATSAAIKEWYAYTAGEYGSDWASWGKSAGKKITYAKADAGWSSTVESRPCKYAAR